MKRILLPLLMLLVTGVLFSCKKKETETQTPYSCATCTRTPQAAAAHDNSSKGIYKGVLIGSSGTVLFNIDNAGTGITAVMVIDGVSVNLTSSISWVSGQPYVAPFTGTLGGQPVTLNFSVGLSGGTPTVTSSSIPGHPNAVFTIVKETSTNMVECFEGQFRGTDTGVFNLVLSRSAGAWFARVRNTGNNSTDELSGAVSASGSLSGVSGSGSTNVTGTINAHVISGNWSNSSGNGTWDGQRTL
ncbi:MAG: hypothetical protein EOO08_02130 [Chitinophagaceae bacterium]|nr:MAG: hypothetical protein EOO08_02130 [Chitinophagaceae bacterium]